MNRNWKRQLVIESLIGAMLFVLVPKELAFAQNDDSRGKRIAKRCVVGATLGAIIGFGLGDKDRAKGAAIGAATFCGIAGATGIPNPNSNRGVREESASFNRTIAPASAPRQQIGVPVRLRNVIMSDGRRFSFLTDNNDNDSTKASIRSMLDQIPTTRGYTVVESEYDGPVDYYMDITVSYAGTANNYGGASMNLRSLFTNENGLSQTGVYDVSVRLVGTDGITDPSRSASKRVFVRQGYQSNRSYFATNISGYSGSSFWGNNPELAAVASALKCFFGPVKG